MTSGNNLLNHQCWQELPGADQTRIFPFLRKVDTNSSNSYIIETPGSVILIDPGGFFDQMDLLATEIESIIDNNPVPVIVFLTHAHVDHFLVIQSHPFFKSHNPVILASHERAAALLSAADGEYTQADLFGRALDPIDVSLKFFSESSSWDCDSGMIGFGHVTGANIEQADIRVDDHNTIRRQVIISGPGGNRIDIFETPGHSPDSVCYRVGGILFIGDLLFAANPGIAGIRGWNQKDLITSIGKVLWLLDNEDIRMCCPGHGRLISLENARTILSAVRDDAGSLGEIAEVTPGWAQETAQYAESLMDRVAGCFTIMAGRCYRAAHVLEELEESGAAETISGILNIRVIDEILEEFHRFNEDYRGGNQKDVHLALKAGQIASKLENVYKSEGLDLVIDPYLPRRVARLLSDYMTIFRGFRQPSDKEVFEPDGTLGLFIKQFAEPGCSDEELMGLADNEEEYRKAFIRRLVRVPLFSEDPVVFEPSGKPCSTCADIERLNDLVASILEELAGADYAGIKVGVQPGENSVIISIQARKTGREMTVSGRDLYFMKKECEIAGGSLSTTSEGPFFSVTIALPTVV
ncbi:MAG TPA: MBL fold metallo-hydrolase [Methanoregulaceae archaeon]|nr:MBL fold metallo-hydrolase [Methanoregulaceae archaeon]